MIRRMKNVVPHSTLISVYNACVVQPHFDYCSLAWDIGNVYSLEKQQKMQNRAAGVITGRSYEVKSETILQDLGWQPLIEKWRENKVAFMYKAKNGKYLTTITDIFNVKINENYNLRNYDCDFSIKKPKTNFLKKVSATQE